MRVPQIILIVSTLLASWLGMQACHELGHVMGAAMTGGKVSQVVLHPLRISRTDLAENPQPLIVVWAGPILGIILPGVMWLATCWGSASARFLGRFFCGFCLVANGGYIGLGSFGQIGDCGVMLQQGSPAWQLWLFGLLTVPAGLGMWHGQGRHFGFGGANGKVERQGVLLSVLAFVIFTLVAFAIGGE